MNLVLQFLFYELRNANKVRKWFYRKLSLELDELISKTTTGKLFDKLSVCFMFKLLYPFLFCICLFVNYKYIYLISYIFFVDT